MSMVLDLPTELEAELNTEAAELGVPLSEYVVQLLSTARSHKPELHSGAELVEYWQRQGLIGTRADISDSQTQARVLREQAQTRQRP